MAKVKKMTALTGVRNVKAGKNPGRGGRGAGAGTAPRTKAKAVKAVKAVKAAKPTKSARVAKVKRTKVTKLARTAWKSTAKAPVRRAPPPPAAPVVHARVKELDPQRKCGIGTSVQLLYRVDQTVDGRASAHLVFFDRHGWYCEHGRTCPAVAHARKHNGQFARASR